MTLRGEKSAGLASIVFALMQRVITIRVPHLPGLILAVVMNMI